jgi:hypothetical protein
MANNIQNPFLLMPTAAKAWAEGFTKGFDAISSPEPSDSVAAGVVTGEKCATEGISLGDPCIPASEEHGPLHIPGMVMNGVEIVHGLWEARHLAKLAGGVAGIVVALVELACTLPDHVLPPEQVLPALGQPVVDALAAYGIDSMELFCGAGLDAAAVDCEIRLTPLFTSLDRARDNAIAMNPAQWVVVNWRTDQSGSFRIVDAS